MHNSALTSSEVLPSDAIDAVDNAGLQALREACGPAILTALEDPAVVEVMVNPDSSIWMEKHGVGCVRLEDTCSPTQAVRILSLVRTMQFRSDGNALVVEGRFPLDGSRIAGVLPPLADNAAFSIRKHSPKVIALDEYRQNGVIRALGAGGTLSASEALMNKVRQFRHPIDALREAVSRHRNILVIGGTGSGKTTLVNALLHEIGEQCATDRVVSIEDTAELQVSNPNHVSMQAATGIAMPDLLRVTMRMRPDRIVVGEVRGAEAYTLLKSWNSGHAGGVATLHANSAEEGLQKLSQYVFEDPQASNFSADSVGWMVAQAVHLIVVIERVNSAPWRMVTDICEVMGYMNNRYSLNALRLQAGSGMSEFKLRI